jgi:hypothetical protein
MRKHRAIRASLGISVPVPVETNAVLEAILEGLLLRGKPDPTGGQLTLFDEDIIAPRRAELHREWDAAADRERRSRTVFAQESIKANEVAEALEATRAAIGSEVDVAQFVVETLRAHGASLSERDGAITADLRETPRGLRDLTGMGNSGIVKARFTLPISEGEVYLARTDPAVESLAAYVLDTALDPQHESVARRAGIVRTRAVKRRTTLLLLRLRFDVVTIRNEIERRQLAEEARVVAFAGPPNEPDWLSPEEAENLLEMSPDANVAPELARQVLNRILDDFQHLYPHLEDEARRRAVALAETYRRLREGAAMTGVRFEVEPKLPADILGVYVYLPIA